MYANLQAEGAFSSRATSKLFLDLQLFSRDIYRLLFAGVQPKLTYKWVQFRAKRIWLRKQHLRDHRRLKGLSSRSSDGKSQLLAERQADIDSAPSAVSPDHISAERELP